MITKNLSRGRGAPQGPFLSNIGTQTHQHPRQHSFVIPGWGAG